MKNEYAARKDTEGNQTADHIRSKLIFYEEESMEQLYS